MLIAMNNAELTLFDFSFDIKPKHPNIKRPCRWKQHRQALMGVANRLGIPFIPIRTDSDVHQALMQGMRFSGRTRILR